METEVVLCPPVEARGPQGMARDETALPAIPEGMPASPLEGPTEDKSTPPRTEEAAPTQEELGVVPAGQILAS